MKFLTFKKFMLTNQLNCEIIYKMQINKSENYLLGISDFYFFRNKHPVWLKFKLHQKEWKEGWTYAKEQEYKR